MLNMNTKLIYHGYKIKRKNDNQVRKKAKIRNQYNHIRHLAQETFLESENTHQYIKFLQKLPCQYRKRYSQKYLLQCIRPRQYMLIGIIFCIIFNCRSVNRCIASLEIKELWQKTVKKDAERTKENKLNKIHHVNTEVVALKEHLLQCIKPSSFTTSS